MVFGRKVVILLPLFTGIGMTAPASRMHGEIVPTIAFTRA